MVLEEISDGELWKWGCNYGNPGSMNDNNILNSSTTMQRKLEGTTVTSFKYKVNGRTKNQGYFLVDGIYPKWALFISTISEENRKRDK